MGTRMLVAALLLTLAWTALAGPLDLHQAVSAGDKAAVVRLLNKGAKVDARDEKRNTALHLAVILLAVAQPKAGDLDIVECLVAGGADVDAINAGQSTPVGQACLMAVKGTRTDLRDMLLSAREETDLDALCEKHGIKLPAPRPIPGRMERLFIRGEKERQERITALRNEAAAVQRNTKLSGSTKRHMLARMENEYKAISDPAYFRRPPISPQTFRLEQVGEIREPIKVVRIWPDKDEALVSLDGVNFIVANSGAIKAMTTGASLRLQGSYEVVEARDIAEPGQSQRIVWVLRRFYVPRSIFDRRHEVLARAQ